MARSSIDPHETGKETVLRRRRSRRPHPTPHTTNRVRPGLSLPSTHRSQHDLWLRQRAQAYSHFELSQHSSRSNDGTTVWHSAFGYPVRTPATPNPYACDARLAGRSNPQHGPLKFQTTYLDVSLTVSPCGCQDFGMVSVLRYGNYSTHCVAWCGNLLQSVFKSGIALPRCDSPRSRTPHADAVIAQATLQNSKQFRQPRCTTSR